MDWCTFGATVDDQQANLATVAEAVAHLGVPAAMALSVAAGLGWECRGFLACPIHRPPSAIALILTGASRWSMPNALP